MIVLSRVHLHYGEEFLDFLNAALNSLSVLYVCIFLFSRRTRECSKENFPEVGQLPLGSRQPQNRRLVRRFTRRENAT